MKDIDKSKPVAVTGGTGYLASWIVKHLLDRGMTVKTSVRNLKESSKFDHLMKIQGAVEGRLQIIEADLLSDGSYDEVVKDCELVIHAASPFKIAGVKDYLKDVIEPALEGTKNVLGSVNRASSVRRVILTASAATIYGDAADISEKADGIFTGADWNTTSTAKHQPYSFSKTIAEKQAWMIAGSQSRWDLVTIHPGFVLGPSLTNRKDSTSIDFMLSFMNGRFKMGAPDLWFGIVDVRDAALLHVLAGITPNASGRYIAVGESYSMVQLAEIIVSEFGKQYPVSARKLPNALFYIFGPLMGFSLKFVSRNIGYPLKFDNTRTVKELGMNFRKVNETLKDHILQIEKDGLKN